MNDIQKTKKSNTGVIAIATTVYLLSLSLSNEHRSRLFDLEMFFQFFLFFALAAVGWLVWAVIRIRMPLWHRVASHRIEMVTEKSTGLSARVVRSLAVEELDEAASLAADAFVDSPFYVSIFRRVDRTQRRVALTWLFSRNLRLFYCKDPHSVWGVRDEQSDRLLCCFCLIRAKDSKLSMMDMLSFGMAWMPLVFGMDTVNRMLTISHWLDEREVAFDKGCNWRLFRMCVAPEAQGKGIGSTALAAVMKQRVTKDGILLTTQLERNVIFYRRLGFELVDEVLVPPEGGGDGKFKSYTMTKKRM